MCLSGAHVGLPDLGPHVELVFGGGTDRPFCATQQKVWWMFVRPNDVRYFIHFRAASACHVACSSRECPPRGTGVRGGDPCASKPSPLRRSLTFTLPYSAISFSAYSTHTAISYSDIPSKHEAREVQNSSEGRPEGDIHYFEPSARRSQSQHDILRKCSTDECNHHTSETLGLSATPGLRTGHIRGIASS
jgi:hypothetical protein